MMRAILLLTLGTAAVAGSATAHAQQYSTKETRAISHAYAKCVVARKHRLASEALLTNVSNADILRQYRSLIIGDCLVRQTGTSSRMIFQGDLYRYALADALVNRELAKLAVPDLSLVPRLSHYEAGEAPLPVAANGRRLSKKKYEAAVREHEKSKTVSALSKYGECVVRGAPAAAKALLLTVPDSDSETAQFRVLQPALATCLAEGNTIRFARSQLRGTIAINYYRLARAAGGSATGRSG